MRRLRLPCSSLNLHIDDLANDKAADDGHAARDIEQFDADFGPPEQAHVLGVDEIEQKTEDNGKHGENPSGHSSLRSVGTDLTPETEAFADDVGDLVEHLGEVTPTFLLDEDGGNHHFQVVQGNAGDEVVHGRA